MTGQSLTAKSAKNSVVALLFYAVNLILQFVSRKVFIDYLGEDILGLNTTLSSILQFLNIAELGIGSAIGYTLYKPLYNSDTNAINEIVSLQGWLYRKIATVIIIASAILMLLFPWIFAKTDLPLWFSYSTYAVLLFSSLLGYFVNYRQIVLSADQKEYKIQYSYKAAVLMKLICQIIFIRFSGNGYIWWLVLEAVFAIIASLLLRTTVKRTYPFLKSSELSGKELMSKHPVVWTKTKQLFFHKIGGVVLDKVSPIIIYGLTTLELVAIYGNYMLIMSGVFSLISAIFNSMNAGVGNLVASSDTERIKKVFNELFSIRFLITSVICFCMDTLTQPFMEIWMGEDMLLDETCLIIFIATTFIKLNRLTADAFINAYGLFSDIWAPLTEALVNIGLSIVLGKLWGLKGVLSGVLISTFLIIFCWKQYYLYRDGFRTSFAGCIKLYIIHIIPAAIAFPIISGLYDIIIQREITGMVSWFGHACIYAGLSAIVLGLLLSVFTPGMRMFLQRMRRIIGNVF